VIAHEILNVPEGYWGRFEDLPTLGLALLAGGFWGSALGATAGAVAVPILSLMMGF